MNLSLQEQLERLFKISESSIEASKVAIDMIHQLHCEYCSIFRNEIDNLWGQDDGRYKMLNKFTKAREPFNTIIALEKKLRKANKESK